MDTLKQILDNLRSQWPEPTPPLNCVATSEYHAAKQVQGRSLIPLDAQIRAGTDFCCNSSLGEEKTISTIAQIRDRLCLSVSDLADLFEVDRQTIYAWVSGPEPRGEVGTKICKVAAISAEVDSANIERLDQLIHRRIVDGRSLFDLIKQNDPYYRDAIKELAAIAQKEAQTRKQSKGFEQLRSLDDVSDDFPMAVVKGRGDLL